MEKVKQPKGGAAAFFKKIVEEHQYKTFQGVLYDAFTANAVVQVYDALDAGNQAKFEAMGPAKMVTITWKLVG